MKKLIKRIKYLFRRSKIQKAVFDEDLISLLESFDVLEAVNAGNYKCNECNCTINIENIGTLYKQGNEIKFKCNKMDCLSDS
jgi:hypothetical protein